MRNVFKMFADSLRSHPPFPTPPFPPPLTLFEAAWVVSFYFILRIVCSSSDGPAHKRNAVQRTQHNGTQCKMKYNVNNFEATWCIPLIIYYPHLLSLFRYFLFVWAELWQVKAIMLSLDVKTSFHCRAALLFKWLKCLLISAFFLLTMFLSICGTKMHLFMHLVWDEE